MEYGIGDGPNTEHLLKQGYTVHGIDISEGALKSTKKRLQGNIHLNKNLFLTRLQINAKNLDFEDDTFDYIVALSVLSLLGNLERINMLLSEFKRVTKPGGKLILDINDQNSEFSAGKKEVYKNIFSLESENDNMECYCLKKEGDFKELLESFFIVKDVGFLVIKFSEKELMNG